MFIYLAESIDFKRESAWSAEFSQTYLAMQLETSGDVLYRPAHAWQYGSDLNGVVPIREAEAVFDLNRAALDLADVVVAIMPPGQTSLGVPTEIGWATDQGQPVILLTDEYTASRSLTIRGNSGIRVALNAEAFVQHLEDARAELAEADQRPTYRELPFTVQEGATGLNARFHDGDAAFDLHTTEDTTVFAGQYAMIPCGVSIEFPPDVFGWIVSRSSTFKQWGLHVLPGIIDSGFRGEMAVSCQRVPNWTDNGDQFVIPAGTRLAQIVLLPNVARNFMPRRVTELNAGDRGLNGWGSTTRSAT